MKRNLKGDSTLDRRHFSFGIGVTTLAWGVQAGAQAPAPLPLIAPPPASDVTATLLKPSQWKLLQDTLAQADTHGFALGEFGSPGMDDMLLSPDPATRSEGGRLLIGAILRYAKAVKVGRLPLDAFPTDWGLRPPPYDPAPEFLQAVANDRLAAWIASLPPPYAGYQALRQSLINWRKSAVVGDWPPIPAGVKLTAGSKDGRVLLLRRKLAALGYSVDPDRADWDESLTTAVMQFQKRHGLSPDGIVANASLEALNVPPRTRERQIVANLERWRWLPPTLPDDRIQVNIVAGILTLFQGAQPVLSMRAVAGKVGNETPMLQSAVHSIVLNPPWNVPASIASKELFPKGSAYLARNGFRVIDGRLQQKAGPNSALGRLKFDFQNPYAVYLHDTPSQSTFSRDERLASHGCVRLQNPRALAKALFKDDPVWTADAIEAGIEAGDTKRVTLPSQIAVFLLYWTAYAGPDGLVNFRADRYGWDELLLKLIEQGRGVPA